MLQHMWGKPRRACPRMHGKPRRSFSQTPPSLLAGFTLHLEQPGWGLPSICSKPGGVYHAFGASLVGRALHREQLRLDIPCWIGLDFLLLGVNFRKAFAGVKAERVNRG